MVNFLIGLCTKVTVWSSLLIRLLRFASHFFHLFVLGITLVEDIVTFQRNSCTAFIYFAFIVFGVVAYNFDCVVLNMVWIIIKSLPLCCLNTQVKDPILNNTVALRCRNYTAIVVLMLFNVYCLPNIISLVLLVDIFISSFRFLFYFGLSISILVL